jgi:hypothetical protein
VWLSKVNKALTWPRQKVASSLHGTRVGYTERHKFRISFYALILRGGSDAGKAADAVGASTEPRASF